MKKYLVLFSVVSLLGCGEPVPALVSNSSNYNGTPVEELPIRLTTSVTSDKFDNAQFSAVTSDNYSGEYIEFIE